MKLTLFAATGGVGKQVLLQALAAGHEVTVVVRDATRLGEVAKSVRVVVAEDLAAADAAVLADAVRGADAVISGLGARTRKEAGIAAAGTRAMVRAMLETGARRLVVISAAPIGTVPSRKRPNPPAHDPGDSALLRFVLYPIIKRVFRDVYADLAEMEDEVRDSGLEWTIVRPPRLLDTAGRGKYRMEVGRNVRGGSTISRADTAHAMLAVLGRKETVGRTVGVAD